MMRDKSRIVDAAVGSTRRSPANNFKLALDGSAEHVVGRIIIECSVSGEANDPRGRHLSIPKIFGGGVACHIRSNMICRSECTWLRK